MSTLINESMVALLRRVMRLFSKGVVRYLVAIFVGTLLLPVGSFSFPQMLNQSHAGPITTSGLILNLDANDINSISGSGATTWKDLSGNGYDATFTGSGSGYATSYDSTNKAMSFSNGTIRSQNTGASASIAKAIPSQTWSGFSASFSANMGVGGTPSGGINDWSRVFDFSATGFSQGSGAKGGMFISRFERSNDLHLAFMNMTTTTFGECAGVNIISNEAFAHYAVTVASDGKCVWYKNGTAWRNYRSTNITNSNTDFGSTGSAQTLPTSDAKTSLRIGRSHWNDIYLSGSIRNLAVYNTTLSSAQVTTNYNGQTAAYVSDVKPTLASASITGTAQVGTQLTAVSGATTGSNITTSYQWRRADTSGGTYSDIASATSSTYTPVSGDGGKYIQVVITVTNSGGSASATSIATGQVSSTVTLTTPAAPTVSATSNTLKSISVSWSAITNASSYTLRLHNSGGTLITTTGLSGRTGTSATITTSNLASLADSTAYKVSITAIGNGTTYLDSAESSKADVTTNAPPGSPTITLQPTARSSVFNSTATFSVTATSPDSGVLAYQWQVNTGSSWENLASGTGFTTNSFTTALLSMTANGYQYRVNVTNTKNGATSEVRSSNAVVLTVSKAEQTTLSLPILSTATKSYPYTQSPLTVSSATGGSGSGALSITAVANASATGCAWNGTTLTASTSGTCTLTITKAGNADYNATSAIAIFTFNKASQSALSITSTSTNFGTNLTLATAGGSSGELVSYVANSGRCSIADGVLSSTSAGDCYITATMAANDYYMPISSASTKITVVKASQSATIGLDPGALTFGQLKALRATSSVAGRVTFKANGKVIPGCIKKPISANATITCSYRPSTRGSVTITVTLDPTDNSYIGTTTFSNSVVGNRTGRRGG